MLSIQTDLTQKVAHHRRAAFSITELLVVMAIIVILSGTIATVYVKAKSSAKVTACLSNLSQIGKATLMYAADNDGYAPPTLTRSLFSGPSSDEMKLTAYGNPEVWKRSLLPYAKMEGVFFCPNDIHARTDFEENCADKENSLFTSYSTVPIVNGDVVENRHVGISFDNPRFAYIPYVTDRVCQGRDYRSGKIAYSSYHGTKQSRLYIDGHVKHAEIRSE